MSAVSGFAARGLCAVLVFSACASSGPPATAAVASDQQVRTIAGSGRPGFTDGPALSATFLLPTAIVRAADGTLYVADEAAQRIREVRPDGSVTTIAGSGALAPDGLSVKGGFANGSALSAKFSRPNGLAIGPGGSLYISERLNACIRKLDHGVVSTFVGKCDERGTADGAQAVARFKDPRALVFDRAGVLYVADYGVGVRVVTPAGTVSTLKFRSSGAQEAWGLTIGGEPADPTLVVSTPREIDIMHLLTHQDQVIGTTTGAEGDRIFGNVNQLVALDHREFLFTDIKASNIRYLRLPVEPFATTVYTQTIAGGEAERNIDNAGYANGSRTSARFFVPRGIAEANGNAYIADAGNRRIREVSLPHFRVPESGFADTTPYDTSHYQILYIGASWVFWDALGDDSICGRLESELDAAHRFAKPVRCHTVRMDAASLGQMEDYLDNYLQGHVDLVVVNVNLSEARSLFPNSNPPSNAAAIEKFHDNIAALKQKLAKSGIKLVLLWNNAADDVSSSENYWEREEGAGKVDLPVDLSDSYTLATRPMIESVAALPVFEVDTYPDFQRAERERDPAVLFGTGDSHMSPRGSAYIAQLLARYIIGEKSI